jgi:hypothetical protein
MVGFPVHSASGAEKPPEIVTIARPAAGYTQIIFHGPAGPFQIQTRANLDPATPWVDMPDAYVTEIGPGVFLGQFPNGREDIGFYRVASEFSGIAELKGWTVLLRVSAPANGNFFVSGESPVVTVTILDTFAQGLSRPDFSTLNLYLYGPQDPRQTETAVKLLNASTNRATNPHHYIDLKTNPDLQVNHNVLTYRLKPVTDEPPGTYTVSLWSVLASDEIQQIMKFATIQIGNGTVESAVVDKTKCSVCHLGPISGRLYMHHIDPGRSPTGNWSLDFNPVESCKNCHNNNGYAAYTDAAAPGGKVPDAIIRRVHGVHMGEGLKLDFNTNSVTGSFKEYTHVVFPADVRNCTKCHLDDRWKTQPSRLACGACHDNTWFGPDPVPAGWEVHLGKEQKDDTKCSICHAPDSGGLFSSVAEAHKVPPPPMNAVDVTMTPPANGTFYVAGERPVVTLVFKNDAGNSIGDHTVVTTANFSTASLFVYGPRSRTLPVLTSLAKYGVDTKRASVTCAVNGPWAINGKTFKIGINGTAPQLITINGASNLVTAAEVVASLNPVITNLNGGAKAFVSGAKVNIRSLIRGAAARIEIFNGEVTTAMGWKAVGVVLEPDVFVAAVSTPGNDLRPVTDPLDYADPMVTRTAANITYQLDDVAGLTPGTYAIYVYYLPVAGKIAGISNPTGIGFKEFQVGTITAEKKIATNCRDCHGDTIWHLTAGPIHAEPFDTDYCKACHDYSHPNTGDLFKNQGGTSLNGWSGFGAMPIVRRVHGVHFGHYLEHSEEIYANATKATFGEIIFPQDVRNCTKCHSETDTWKQKPSRMACLACHDSDEAKAHGKIMTYIPDPTDPYGPLAQESCEVCHGAGKEFSPDKVHDISSPYVPPYPRQPAPP